MTVAAAVNTASSISPPSLPPLAATNPDRSPKVATGQMIPSLTAAAGRITPDFVVFVGSALRNTHHNLPRRQDPGFGWFLFRRRRRRWCFMGLSLRLSQIWSRTHPGTGAYNTEAEKSERFQTEQVRVESVKGKANQVEPSRPGGIRAEPQVNYQPAGAEKELNEDETEVHFLEPLVQA